MLAARQQDPARLADGYQDITSLVLTIDGLQPEKGHEEWHFLKAEKMVRLEVRQTNASLIGSSDMEPK